MSILNQIKAGAKVAPAFLIILYYLSVSLDLYTTLLASPDLKYETNNIVRYFKLNGSQTIIYAAFFAILLSTCFILAITYLHKYFKKSNKFGGLFRIAVFRQKRFLVSLIIMCFFYTNFIGSVIIIFNNYFHYIYLYKIKNFVSNISTWYIDDVILKYPFFFPLYQVFLILLGILFTIHKVNKIRKRFQSELSAEI